MITAAQIATWANSNLAQTELPRLVRRLIHAVAATTQIAMPSGESVVLPGFDGELHSLDENAWVPMGYSCWELSCRADVGNKANEDFDKRTFGTLDSIRQDRTYVAITGRRWPGKGRWQAEKIAIGQWKAVRAYDSDDLEQWLEQSPAVALAFGEELGILGAGVESVRAYIARWGGQSSPAITPEAILTGRQDQVDKLIGRVKSILSGATHDPLAVKADSVQEAVAFAASALLGDLHLEMSALVVTHPDGWRFVEKNAGVRVALAATPAIAEAPTARPDLATIVPYASGDMARQFKGVAGRLNDDELHLERAIHTEFEKALQLVGLDKNDTRRLAALCGRSWSIFRRQHARNPAVRRPAWLDHPASAALTAVCLVGAWSSDHEADIEAVSRIAGRPYDRLEANLRELERLDDSPVVRIGSVWKAKSALELLAIFGEQISQEALDRYFVEVEPILATVDPQLELPDEERYAAAIYGKTRPISGPLFDALTGTLVKLAVKGPDVPSLAANYISERVDCLVSALLRGAGRERWLSLSGLLPALAEASPHEFLTAVEEGIADADGGARAVLLETRGAGIGSRCWHAGLLWGLELLAWAPNRLKRVSLILAKLSEICIEGNWGNNPKSSLLDLYRSWFPQTAATIEQRIDALDFLIERVPDQAFELLDALNGPGSDSASHVARPKWRDDDAGAGYGVTGLEQHRMVIASIDRQIEMARGHPRRIASLIRKFAFLDAPRQRLILDLLAECDGASNAEKDELRSAIRHKLHWHRNYDEKRDDVELQALLEPLEAIYTSLEPQDLLDRHAWLFDNGWAELPVRTRSKGYEEQDRQRTDVVRDALREIYAELGWPGVLALANGSAQPWIVGSHLSHIGIVRWELENWIANEAGELQSGSVGTVLAGAILCAQESGDRGSMLDNIAAMAEMKQAGSKWIARLLLLCPHQPNIWRRAEAIGESDFYWRNCSSSLWLDSTDDMAFALRNLVDHQRPVSALQACHGKFSPHAPELIVDMLEGILQGFEESAGSLPQSYVFQHAIEYLEDSAYIEDMKLVQLEFALINLLGFENEYHAKTLFHVVMSQPEVFVELLCIAYKKHGGEVAEVDDAGRVAAKNAYHTLHSCRRMPGTDRNDAVDPQAFLNFIREARKLASEHDRLEVCDITLGEIIAHAPDGADAFWPFEPARDALEQAGSEEMLRGLYTGAFNKRGVSTRGYFDGGDQERDLAAYYRKHAAGLEPTHPQLAAKLLIIAQSYDRYGLREDLDAQLRVEQT